MPDIALPPDPTIDARPARRDLLRAGLFWGALAGAAELAARGVYWSLRPRVTVGSIRTNHHHLWMAPASDVLVLATVGLVLAILARLVPRLARLAGTFVLAALAFLCVARVADQLHHASGLILAGGLAAVTARRIVRHEAGYWRLVRRATLPLMGLFAAWTAYHLGAVLTSERRADAALPPAAKGAPNVLLLVMDNVRADDLSLYGYERDTTPNLRRLAERGIRFDRARSTASWTLPSHASMLTGHWPHDLSVTVDTPLDDAKTTLAEALAARGYETAGFVANTYYCNAWYGLDRGFSRYEDFAANREISFVEMLRAGSLGKVIIDKFRLGATEWPGDPRSRKAAERINGDFLSWLDGRGDRPYFAFLNYYDAHAPFLPPKGDPRRFGLSTLPEGEREAILQAQRGLIKGKAEVTSRSDEEKEAITARAATLLRDSYDDCIASLDRQIGALFDELERRKALDNTLVVLVADHGEEFGEHTLFGHGVSVYRPEVHVPLLILPPKGPRRRVVSAPVTLRDLPATVFDLIGAGETSPFPGESLARAWASEASEGEFGPIVSEVEHQPKFAEDPAIPASRGPISSILRGRYVYIQNADGREELYDHDADPGELRNLAEGAGARAVLSSLRASLGAILGDEDEARVPMTAQSGEGDDGVRR